MEDKIIKIIFDKLENSNLYNYDNDEELRNIKDINLYENILGNLVIDVVFEHKTYTIMCNLTYADRESVENE